MLLAKESILKFDWKARLCFTAIFLYAIFKSISNTDQQVNVQITKVFSDLVNIDLLILVILLMPINWLMESLKWQSLMKIKDHSYSLNKAIQSVLMGVTVGVITPLRIGEYYGRTLLIGSNTTSQSVFSMFICSLLQNIVTFVVGVIGILFFLEYIEYIDITLAVVLSSSIIMLLLGLIFLIKLPLVINYLKRFQFIKKQLERIDFEVISWNRLSALFFLSFCRYSIYFSQYLILLYFFDVEVSINHLLIGISSIFLIQSMLPLPPFLGLLARAELALLIWSVFEINYIVILSVTFLLWVINLMLPAIVGLIITFKLKGDNGR